MRNIGGIHLLILSLLLGACSRVPGKLLIMEGNFHHARGRYAEAIDSYLKAVEYEETAPYSELGLGSVYFAMGEEKAALDRFSRAGSIVEASPAAASQELRYRIHYNTGVVLFSEGDFSGAVDSFREALKTDGGKKEAKRNLELSIRSLARKNMSGSNAAGSSNDDENESMTALFEYVRQKEFNQWKSREWQQEEDMKGPDY